MKKRGGYVSNSSSSSFIVYGTVCDFDDIARILDKGMEVICVDFGAGTSGDCADFVFSMTKERLALLERHKDTIRRKGICIICKWFSVSEEMYDEKMSIPDLIGGKFFDFSMDYNSPSTDSIDDEDFVEWIKDKVESYQ